MIADPEDISDLARKLRAIAGDPDLRHRLRTRGLRQARRFDWGETAAATLDLYERTAAVYCPYGPVRAPKLRTRLNDRCP